MDKKSILFVTEKWCDLNPELGLTNSYHNTFQTFEHFNNGEYTYDIIHLDECKLRYNADINQILIDYCSKHKVDIIIFTLLNAEGVNPSTDTYIKLRSMGCYLCVIWPDTGPSWGMQTIQELSSYIDLHISWDNPKTAGVGGFHQLYTSPRSYNHISLWTPEDPALYYYEENKDIDVSFMGSVEKYRDREEFVRLAKNYDINIHIGGGQRKEKLSPSQYASIIRRSKIGINFSLSQTGVFHQAKGKMFEYTASGGLLLEFDNPSIKDFFEANIDYVPFTNWDELFTKIKYYLENENERKVIAENGHKTFNDKWNSNIYWKTLLGKIL